jgi:hypothetical protein
MGGGSGWGTGSGVGGGTGCDATGAGSGGEGTDPHETARAPNDNSINKQKKIEKCFIKPRIIKANWTITTSGFTNPAGKTAYA